MRKIRLKIIDYQKNKDFLCMTKDFKLLHNLCEQKVRGYLKRTDYIQPGLAAGQSLESVIEVTLESIRNHLNRLNKKVWL